jgi:hypothetical protein
VIVDLFSKRQKRLRGDVPDVYVYDNLPQPLRVQIVHILTDTLGGEDEYSREVKADYEVIVNALCREYGLFRLQNHSKYEALSGRNYLAELFDFFVKTEDTEKALDVIELYFRVINNSTRNYEYLYRRDASERADQAISELNERFKEHGVGFQFIENEIVRVDSELIHSEAVKPALRLLNSKDYEGAQQEFLSAYEHYRHGNYKESLNDCLKAFESAMKAICDKRGWPYPSNATANALIKVCFDKNLIPSFWQQQITSLRSMLESSIPTGRNKLSGHGQGAIPTEVPDYLVAYMLHMTASTLVFLTTAEKQLG